MYAGLKVMAGHVYPNSPHDCLDKKLFCITIMYGMVLAVILSPVHNI